MFKTIKKISIVFLTGVLLLVSGDVVPAFAEYEENFLNGEYYYDYLFYRTGVTNSKLHEIEDELHVDLYEYFGVETPSLADFEEYLELREPSTAPMQNARAVTTIDLNYNMPELQWNSLLRIIQPSDILVTKDCMTLDLDHGHAALACGDGMTVEHRGPRNVGIPGATGESEHLDMAAVWRHCQSCRLYEVPEIDDDDDTKENIVDYAIDNLIGWNYLLTANIESESNLNCATLVWKAYESEDITLGHILSFTVIPSDFVECNDFDMIFSTGWGHTDPDVWA